MSKYKIYEKQVSVIKEEEEKEYNEYTPKINDWEVAEYENQFRERVYYDVQFKKRENGFSMELYKGKSGIEAIWSGTILLSDDAFIEWEFSIQKGALINAKYTLNDENFEIIPKLYNFYKIWKDEWSRTLTLPEKEELPDATPIQEMKSFLKERKENRTKASIIETQSGRMQILAGVR